MFFNGSSSAISTNVNAVNGLISAASAIFNMCNGLAPASIASSLADFDSKSRNAITICNTFNGSVMALIAV